MDPFLLGLLIFAALRYGITDAIAAARGTESPRVAERRERASMAHREKMARLQGSGPPTLAQAIGQRLADRIANPPEKSHETKPPGPARSWFNELWADAWADAADRRRENRDRAARGDLPRQRAARAFTDRLNGRGADPAADSTDPDGLRTAPDADDDIVEAEIVDDDGRTPPGDNVVDADVVEPDTVRPQAGDTDTAAAQQQWRQGHGHPECTCRCWSCGEGSHCAACRRAYIRRTGQPVPGEPDQPQAPTPTPPAPPPPAAPTAPTAPAAPAAPPQTEAPLSWSQPLSDDERAELLNRSHPAGATPPAPDPTGDPVDQHDQHDTGDPMASVHPIREDQPMTAPTMTEINGETLDPHAALRFVTSLKELSDQIVGQIELSVASLTERGVAGEPIELLSAMQEAFGTASGQCETAQGHFERHLATQDQVLSDDTLAGTVQDTYVGTAS